MPRIQISKLAIFTDIHFGAKSNAVLHNEDCLEYIDWFIEQVKLEGDVDAICFGGDWHENRSALNIQTLNAAYEGARRINELGIPVIFTIGNHDLFHRHSRDVHSTTHFSSLDNFIIVEEPTVFENDKGDDFFICPYIFHDEYKNIVQYNHVPIWIGHFEFKDFIVTGADRKMPIGPDASVFSEPKLIMSGHFHKRQIQNNVTYIGNTFPTNFGDAGDDNRGMCFYDLSKDSPDEAMAFVDWEDCPKYRKCKLSQLLDGDISLSKNMRVKCIADVQISFEESTKLRELFMDEHDLREFTLEESMELREALAETESGIDWSTQQLASVDELVIQMLQEIDSKQMSNDKLMSIYSKLTPQ